jgi:hypothetical protein
MSSVVQPASSRASARAETVAIRRYLEGGTDTGRLPEELVKQAHTAPGVRQGAPAFEVEPALFDPPRASAGRNEPTVGMGAAWAVLRYVRTNHPKKAQTNATPEQNGGTAQERGQAAPLDLTAAFLPPGAVQTAPPARSRRLRKKPDA